MYFYYRECISYYDKKQRSIIDMKLTKERLIKMSISLIDIAYEPCNTNDKLNYGIASN